jgi:hypothetical protein
MKLLDKLNGWQRLGLIATVALQIVVIVQWRVWNYPTWQSCLREKTEEEGYDLETNGFFSLKDCAEIRTYQDTLMIDLQENGIMLALCLAAYVAAYVVVKIVRWVISGFKKDN